MAMGLGAFTEGLQSGIETADKSRFNREYRRMMAGRNDREDLKWQKDVNLMKEQYWDEHGNLDGWTDPARTKMTDPALIRFGKWFKNRMGWGGQQGGAQQDYSWMPKATADRPLMSSIPESSRQAPFWEGPEEPYLPMSRDPNYSPRKFMADGGAVNPFAVRQDMYANPQPWERVQEGRDEFKVRAAERDKRREGASDIERGNINREGFLDVVGSSAGIVGRAAVDAIDQSIPDVAKGFLGLQDGEAPTPAASGHPKRKTVANPYTVDNPHFDPNMMSDTGAATDASVGGNKPDTVIADKAIDDGEEIAWENLDWRNMLQQGMRPSDIPQMSTREWADYRTAIFQREIAYGKSASEAYQSVDDLTVGVQMRGFQREAQKALMYLQAGQDDAAMMAMTMAYQYFPNGATVQFAPMTDPKTGRAAIVGRGFNEETGEPSGTPQLITAERLATMVEQMSNPAAFRAWTKDARQLQLEIAKQNDLRQYRSDALAIEQQNADTRELEAEARLLTGSRGGSSDNSADQRIRTTLEKQIGMLEIFEESPEIFYGLSRAVAEVNGLYGRNADDNYGLQVVVNAFRTAENQQKGAGEQGVIALMQQLQRQGVPTRGE